MQSRWRNRAEFIVGRSEIVAFLRRKWNRELDYRLIKELWRWFRSFGNENWEFDAQGLMTVRHASINDLPIGEHDRRYRWPLGRRPDDQPGLSSFGF